MTSSVNCDVLVVGGGPAGALAACAAASGGPHTVLLERAQVPRYKTCGGGLIGLSLAALPPGMAVPVRAQVSEATFAYRGRWSRTRHSPAPLLTMVNRSDFDAALLAAAAEAGATIRPGEVVSRLAEDGPGHIRVDSSTGALRARVVVGADGTNGRTGRHVGVVLGQVDVGLEVELVMPPSQHGSWTDRIHLDWGPLAGSYGWVFPKRGHVDRRGHRPPHGRSGAA